MTTEDPIPGLCDNPAPHGPHTLSEEESCPGVPDSTAGERPELDDLALRYATARAAREQVSDREKELRDLEGRAEAQLFDAMERMNLRQFRHKTLGLFSLNDQANAVVVDEAQLREWALEVMPELMLPNRQRLGKVVRDTLKEGGELPPGVDASFYRKIGWRRGPLAPPEPAP